MNSNTTAIEIYKASGDNKLELEDYQGSIHEYNKVLDLDSSLREVYLSRGHAKFAIGEDLEAVKDFSRATDIDPLNPEAYYCRILANHLLDDYKWIPFFFNCTM